METPVPGPNSFWKSLGNLFRSPANGEAGESQTALRLHGAGWRLPWRRGRHQSALIQERVERMVELFDSIQAHLARQEEHARELIGSVQRLAGALDQLAEAQRHQVQFLSAISGGVDHVGRHVGSLSEAVRQAGPTLSAQAEAIRSMADRLDAARAVDQELAGSLQSFGRAIDALRDSGVAQAETLRRLHGEHVEQRDLLRSLVREQTRRLLVIVCAAAVLGLAGLGALLTVVLWRAAGGPI